VYRARSSSSLTPVVPINAAVPTLAQAEGYFREIAPHVLRGCDVGQEWDLLACRQAHRPAGVTRFLEVIIDESALDLRLQHRETMAEQIRPSAKRTVPVISTRPASAPAAAEPSTRGRALPGSGRTPKVKLRIA
jgi:hypothetical protein